MNFAVSACHRGKIQEIKKIKKYFYCDKEVKKLWKMNVMVMSIGVGALEWSLEGLERRFEEFQIKRRIKTVN